MFLLITDDLSTAFLCERTEMDQVTSLEVACASKRRNIRQEYTNGARNLHTERILLDHTYIPDRDLAEGLVLPGLLGTLPWKDAIQMGARRRRKACRKSGGRILPTGCVPEIYAIQGSKVEASQTFGDATLEHLLQ
jgi:hypothetical protein